jgi:hypothetical protein
MPHASPPPQFPDSACLSALRTWYAGVGSSEAVERYCPQAIGDGQSARGVIGRIRRQLAGFALSRHRDDLVALFQCAAGERTRHRKAVTRALDILPTLAVPQPQVSDLIDAWLWNTVYLERSMAALRQQLEIDDSLISHVAPLGWNHINLTGDYVWHANKRVAKGRFRPLRIRKSTGTS